MMATTSIIRKSDKTDLLYAAISAFHGAVSSVAKTRKADISPRDSNKQSYSYTYADLAETWETIREAMAECKLACVQIPTLVQTHNNAQQMILVTHIGHPSGQWIEGDYPVSGISGSLDHKALGGALTYARRYALWAILSLSPTDEAPDGVKEPGADEKVAEERPAPRPRQPPRDTSASASSARAFDAFRAAIGSAVSVRDLDKIKKDIGESLVLTRDDYAKLKDDWIRRREEVAAIAEQAAEKAGDNVSWVNRAIASIEAATTRDALDEAYVRLEATWADRGPEERALVLEAYNRRSLEVQ